MKRLTFATLLAALLLLAPLAYGQDPGLLVALDFNEIQDGHYVDQSPAHLPAPIFGALPCAGVDGLGVRIPGGNQSVNVDLPPAQRALEAVTIEAWISPDEPSHSCLISAPDVTLTNGKWPFMLRWRQNWELWFHLTAADGEERMLRSGQPGVTSLTRPQRTWTHVVGTYDGTTSVFYVNGQVSSQRTWPTGRKALMPIGGPVQVGGRGEAFKGDFDNVRLYNRALSAEEVAAHFAARENFQPALPPGQEAKLPGTLDGLAYVHDWQTIRIAQGNLIVSNNGLVTPDSSPPGGHVQTGFYPLNLVGQGDRRDRFFTEVTGNLELRSDNSASLTLSGKTGSNLQLNETVQVNPQGEALLRYELTALAPQAPAPVLSWPYHLWPSALRFVSSDDRGPVTGTLMDLDGELRLQDLTELNLMRGNTRLVLLFAPGTIWHLAGTRDPRNWLGGYGTFPTDLRPAEWKSWAETPTAVIELSLRIEPDNLPPHLDRAAAREVTPPKPYDFSALYAGDPKLLRLVPQGADLPVWMEGTQVAFQVAVPEALAPQVQSYAWTLADAYTAAPVSQGNLPAGAQALTFPAPPGGAYVVKLSALDAAQKSLAEATSELVIAGEIPQRKQEPGDPLPLRKVDEVDFTAADPGHDFFSFSGASQVVGTGRQSYRRTLTYQEAFAHGGSSGRGVYDWFGVRFKTEPGKIYVLETEYPDLDGMSISLYLNEPKDDATDGKAIPLTRTASGLFTGGYLPHDNTLKTFQTVHFASAPWVTVAYQNAHNERTPGNDLAPCSIKRATLYEVVNGDLPLLDAPITGDRLVGVHCESGALSLCSFSPHKLRGENGNWSDRPAPGEYYRDYYRAIVNLIRYLRYRGDNALYFGAYRYRSACFPSRLWPPASTEVEADLPALMARMFERNGLKLILVNQPCDPLPVARLHQNTRWDVAQGAPSTVPVDLNGDLTTASPSNPSANPFNPDVVNTYATLAAEEGRRYGKYPAVAGISFICGDNWMEPCLPLSFSGNREDYEAGLLRTTFDDDTITRFEAWAHLTVPADPQDPGRFKVRHDWILANAREQYIEFRCWATAQTQLALAAAFRAEAPQADFIYMDFYGGMFSVDLPWTPLETLRRLCSDPRYLRGPGFVHMPYLPEANGTRLFEHARMDRSLMPQLMGYLTNDELAAAWDAPGRTARYVHRQFYEQGLELPTGRSWVWAPTAHRLSTCSYPQEGGRGYLADFALTMARSTPNYFTYMWCDSTTPLGMEPMHQEFARLFRSLPAGHYREAGRQNGVFCRYLDKPAAFYVVNTTGAPVAVDALPTGLQGKFVQVNTGEEVTLDQPEGSFDLQAYELQVYLPR